MSFVDADPPPSPEQPRPAGASPATAPEATAHGEPTREQLVQEYNAVGAEYDGLVRVMSSLNIPVRAINTARMNAEPPPGMERSQEWVARFTEELIKKYLRLNECLQPGPSGTGYRRPDGTPITREEIDVTDFTSVVERLHEQGFLATEAPEKWNPLWASIRRHEALGEQIAALPAPRRRFRMPSRIASTLAASRGFDTLRLRAWGDGVRIIGGVALLAASVAGGVYHAFKNGDAGSLLDTVGSAFGFGGENDALGTAYPGPDSAVPPAVSGDTTAPSLKETVANAFSSAPETATEHLREAQGWNEETGRADTVTDWSAETLREAGKAGGLTEAEIEQLATGQNIHRLNEAFYTDNPAVGADANHYLNKGETYTQYSQSAAARDIVADFNHLNGQPDDSAAVTVEPNIDAESGAPLTDGAETQPGATWSNMLNQGDTSEPAAGVFVQDFTNNVAEHANSVVASTAHETQPHSTSSKALWTATSVVASLGILGGGGYAAYPRHHQQTTAEAAPPVRTRKKTKGFKK